ncbi:hypothetical protein ACN42_g7253 [Penicillium freii]|uniref:Actin-like ATPase domain-containing protein n=1 Tax=Penicillium freii TaxID=48697 RepID=A0A101MFY8_PENFR|nr:hypothetical protein ACN42_g7253 [Penicillium freii]
MEVGSGYKLVVAVDYGTTLTKIAFAIKNDTGGQTDIDSILLMESWPPHIVGITNTPSLLSYTHNGEPHLWGFEVKPGMQSYAWTKLLLDKDVQHSEFNDEMLMTVTGSEILKLPDQKKAVDTVADYLSRIHAHIRDHIPEAVRVLRGQKEDLSGIPIDFLFTIPATWSGETQLLMSQAIEMAGFGRGPLDRFWTATEPEAAALAVFGDNTFNLQAHDGVLICDCGGGTVDITTYYVTDVVPTISVEQITAAMGAKCGGTAIDSRFYELVYSRLEGGFDNLPMSEIQPGSSVMQRFETIKRTFDGKEEATWHFDLNFNATGTHLASSNQRRKRFVLRSQDIRDFYKDVLGSISGLIRSQIGAANKGCGREVINKVVLVGGFSASPYLQESLQRALKQQIGNISVLVPDEPGETIVRGAALQGLRGCSLPTYKCWRNYGLASVQPFALSNRNELQGLEYGTDTLPVNLLLHWVLCKDQRYPKGFQSSCTIQLLHWENDLLVKPVEIYKSNLPVAPQRFGNSDVRSVDYIECHFNGLDLSRFPHQTIAGQTVYYLEVSVEVSFPMTDRVIRFSARALGQDIGEKYLTMAHD